MELKKVRDAFAKSVSILDELIALDERENNGENVEDETEEVLGRFLVQMIKIQTLTHA